MTKETNKEYTQFIKYPSIIKLSGIKKNAMSGMVKKYRDVNGLGNEDRELTEDEYRSIILPKDVQCNISEKIHGTNFCVAYNDKAGIWTQSRTRILSPLQDNAGCANAVVKNRSNWLELLSMLISDNNINTSTHSVYLYGEWAGGNVQGKSALTGLDKHWVLFQYFAIAPIGSDDILMWLPTKGIDNKEANILNITNYATESIKVDLNNINKTSEYLESLIPIYEAESPLGKAFGKVNVGEGVVGSVYDEQKKSLIQFKVKGTEHTKSNKMPRSPAKALNDTELKHIAETAYKVCPEWRLEQMYKEIVPVGTLDMRGLGKYLKAVSQDILKEEEDTLLVAELTMRDIGKYTNEIAREYYKNCIAATS